MYMRTVPANVKWLPVDICIIRVADALLAYREKMSDSTLENLQIKALRENLRRKFIPTNGGFK